MAKSPWLRALTVPVRLPAPRSGQIHDLNELYTIFGQKQTRWTEFLDLLVRSRTDYLGTPPSLAQGGERKAKGDARP